MSVIRVVALNVGGRADLGQITRLAEDTGHPLGIALQEVRLDRTIDGYQRVAIGRDEQRHPDDGGMQLLVREDATVIARRLVSVGGPWWIGPKGDRHPPKIFVGATVEHHDRRLDLLSVHRVWQGPHRRNQPTWDAEHHALREWLLARAERTDGSRPVLALGDWNGRQHDTGTTSITRLAGEVDGALAMAGIDGALALNAHVAIQELPHRYHPDAHNAIACRMVTP